MKKKEKHTLKYNTNHFCAVVPSNCRIVNLESDEDIQRDLNPACPKFAHNYEDDAELSLLNYARQAFVSTIRTGRKKKKKKRGPVDLHALLQQDDRILVNLVVDGVERESVRLKVAFEQPPEEVEFDTEETRAGEIRSHFGFNPGTDRFQPARGNSNGREKKTKKVKRKKAAPEPKKPKPLQMELEFDEEEYETEEEYTENLVWLVVVHANHDEGLHGFSSTNCGA